MKRKLYGVALCVLALSLLAGCGSGGGDDAAFTGGDGGEIIDPATGNDSPPPVDTTPGDLGSLVDLGDLYEPLGDHWYFTKAAAINDSGDIVGQSNAGSPVKAAFHWSPETDSMEFIGIHDAVFDDYYGLKSTPSQKYFIYSEAININNNGMIICNSTTGTDWPEETEKRGFVYNPQYITVGGNLTAPDPNSPYIDLAPPPYLDASGNIKVGSFSEVVDINDKGQIVLTAEDQDGIHAYFWDGSKTQEYDLTKEDESVITIVVPDYIFLGRILGENGEAVALNNASQAVINSGDTAVFHDLGDDVNDPFDDIIQSLNHLPGASETTAVDMNDIPASASAGERGHIIGNSGNQGFFWDGGAMYPLGSLGGGSSEVADLNNNDVVVGHATTEDGKTHAFRWRLVNGKGVMEDLGTLGGDNSYAVAINDAGQIVGYSETGEVYQEGDITLNIEHAFLWDNGTMYDLGTHSNFYNEPDYYPFAPPYPFSRAVGINASGQVAGNSESINEHPRGFLLTPVFP